MKIKLYFQLVRESPSFDCMVQLETKLLSSFRKEKRKFQKISNSISNQHFESKTTQLRKSNDATSKKRKTKRYNARYGCISICIFIMLVLLYSYYYCYVKLLFSAHVTKSSYSLRALKKSSLYGITAYIWHAIYYYYLYSCMQQLNKSSCM